MRATYSMSICSCELMISWAYMEGWGGCPTYCRCTFWFCTRPAFEPFVEGCCSTFDAVFRFDVPVIAIVGFEAPPESFYFEAPVTLSP
mmetsp:Transcript_3324/g.3888  ORF Transcript_3324/g.3888 Transcript_3324/m.3888 type:complete len:88 (+) Transcript_3324:446-709(+)